MKCIICKRQTFSYDHPKFDMTFHECPSCKVIFKDIKNHIGRAEEFAVYENHQNSTDNQGYVDYLTHFIETAIVPYQHQNGLKALDYGSGPGPVLAEILKNQYGYQTDTYDPFYAPKQTFINHTYDLITCTEVIEHVKAPIDIFKIFKNHLSQNGILAIMTLFHPQDRNQFFDWFYIRDPSHIIFYTPDTIKIICKQVGLKLINHNHHRIMTIKHQ
jgi:hypothetical protein